MVLMALEVSEYANDAHVLICMAYRLMLSMFHAGPAIHVHHLALTNELSYAYTNRYDLAVPLQKSRARIAQTITKQLTSRSTSAGSSPMLLTPIRSYT